MISKKIYNPAEPTNRFLSDFVIRNEQYARPYAFFYDTSLPADGSGDILQDGTTDQANHRYPDNLWKRGSDYPSSEDIITQGNWSVIDSSINFYEEFPVGATLWLEVATTSEEFGNTLTQPSVEYAKKWANLSAAWAEGVEPGGVGTKSSKYWEESSKLAATASEDSYQRSLAVEADVVSQGNTQVDRVESEGNSQYFGIVTEGYNQKTMVTSEGDSQVSRVIVTGNDQVSRIEDLGIDSRVPQTAPTGAAVLPTGTTAQRPTPTTGYFRYNTDLGDFEGYNGTSWWTVGTKLNNTSGGSITLEADPSVTTAETIIISPTEIQVSSPNGGKWAILVDDFGSISTELR